MYFIIHVHDVLGGIPKLAEGIGLENRQAVKGAGVRIPLPPPLKFSHIAG
jgi:hypothetical protein